MNESRDELVVRLHRLAVRQQEAPPSDEDRAELRHLLASPEARRTYLQYIQDTVSLRWIYSGHMDRALKLPPSGVGGSAYKWRALAAAAAIIGIAGFVWNHIRDEGDLGAAASAGRAPSVGAAPGAALPPAANVATVTVISGVAWPASSPGPGLLSRVGVGAQLQFSTGLIELTFDTGAQVNIFGPADIQISSPMSIVCSRGRVTTLVGESGKGFTIDTPKARIVDLGTQFGVNISEQGDTEVVVFQGSVDLMRNSSAPPATGGEGGGAKAWTRRLQQGDALSVGDADEARRVVAVRRSDFFPSADSDAYGRRLSAPVIEDVRDNIRDGESTKCYQIVRGGLREDAGCFVDRSHQWNGVDETGIPGFLLGAEYIMPFNDDKFISDLRVDVQISRPATCYVFLDDNMTPPKWLRESFKDTGLEIGLDGAKTIWHKNNSLGVGPGESVDFVFSIWRREVDGPGTVTFGGVKAPEIGARTRGFNMYGIAVAPK